MWHFYDHVIKNFPASSTESAKLFLFLFIFFFIETQYIINCGVLTRSPQNSNNSEIIAINKIERTKKKKKIIKVEHNYNDKKANDFFVAIIIWFITSLAEQLYRYKFCMLLRYGWYCFVAYLFNKNKLNNLYLAHTWKARFVKRDARYFSLLFLALNSYKNNAEKNTIFMNERNN